MKNKFKETEMLELKKSTSELKEAIVSMVAILNKHKKITTKEYCELFGVVKDTANRDLNSLLSKKLIEKMGNGPKIYYVLSTVRYCPILPDKGKKGGKNV